MILEEETFKKYGYYPKDLKPKSNRRIIVKCDDCGKIRESPKYEYARFCISCCRKGVKNPNFGKSHSCSKETRIKIGIANKGKMISEEQKIKMREFRIGSKASIKTKEKMSNSHKGGVSSTITRKKISDSLKGRKHSIEARQKMSVFAKKRLTNPEKNPMWKGGISYEPYCIKFNDDLKERVRKFFDRRCYLCDKTEIENGQRLSVHHVNYDKTVCCNDIKPLFVPLCKKCHNKTNSNREYWQVFFTISLEYLTNGECYLKKRNNE